MRWSHFLLAIFLIGSALGSVHAGNPEWQKCIQVPVIGQACVDVVIDPSALQLNISLILNGNVLFTDTLSASHLCVDDDTLLTLLSDIPALLPYKPIIEEIIKIHGFIPADVLSLCIVVNNLDIDYNAKTASGCPELDTKLICIENKCLYTGSDQFGCFHINW